MRHHEFCFSGRLYLLFLKFVYCHLVVRIVISSSNIDDYIIIIMAISKLQPPPPLQWWPIIINDDDLKMKQKKLYSKRKAPTKYAKASKKGMKLKKKCGFGVQCVCVCAYTSVSVKNCRNRNIQKTFHVGVIG